MKPENFSSRLAPQTDSSFGQRLREERSTRGLSLQEFAGKVAVTKGYLSRLELGKAKPSSTIIGRIATTLAIDPTPLHVLAGYLPIEVQQILHQYPIEAPAVLRETFGVYGVNQETKLPASASQQSRRRPILSSEGTPKKLYETFHADCFLWLDQREANSLHAVVTDPPYGLKEYTAVEKEKLRRGRGGVWRIPPSFDGCVRSPLPRFTVLTKEDKSALRHFFSQWATKILRVLVPGGHVFLAATPLLSHLIYQALEELEFYQFKRLTGAAIPWFL